MPNPYPDSDYWPAHWDGCTLTGQFVGLDGNAAIGTLTLTAAPNRVAVPLDGVIINPVDITIILATDGSLKGLDGDAESEGAVVPGTKSAYITPSGWTYTVTQSWDGASYPIQAPAGQTVDLLTVAPIGEYEGVLVLAQSGGAAMLSDLTDVELTDLTDGQILAWNAGSSKWVNVDNSGGGGTDATVTSDDAGTLTMTPGDNLAISSDAAGSLSLTPTGDNVASDGHGTLTITV